MKKNELHKLTTRLQGFDNDELQREMTDGLEQWCHKHQQREQTARRVVAMTVLLVTLSTLAMTVSPNLRRSVFHQKEEVPQVQTLPTKPSMPEEAPVSPDTLEVVHDTVVPTIAVQEVQKTVVVEPVPWYDFAVVLPQGDSLYCRVMQVARSISVGVQGSALHPAGALELPAAVEHEGLRYEITALEDSAFADCRELRRISLPPTLVTIGRDAFNGCSALDTVVSLAVQPPRIVGEWCFWEVPQEAVLLVPCRSGTTYRSAHCWDYFDSIIDTCDVPPLPEHPQPTVRFNGNYLIVEGVYGEVVRVYDFEGRLIASELCNGQCRISVGSGRSFHYTSAFLIQVGDRPAIKVSAPLRNSAPVGDAYRYWGNGM
jgi:hypothetical protein